MGRHKNFTGGSFWTLSQAEVALGWQVQMTTAPKETRDDYSSKNTGRDCGVGFGCVCDDFAGERPDRAGMQRQIPGCEIRRHARRPEVERLPESPVRRRR